MMSSLFEAIFKLRTTNFLLETEIEIRSVNKFVASRKMAHSALVPNISSPRGGGGTGL